MYVNPFVAGVLCTLGVEVVAAVVMVSYAVARYGRKKKQEGQDNE